MKTGFIQARTLRSKNELNKIDKTKPGYYKWWAAEEQLNILLNKLELTIANIGPIEEKQNVNGRFYCIYIGIAVKESVRSRLDWHINQTHTRAQVENGTLSTFRQTVSCLVGKDMLDKKATDTFIDELFVEYFLLDCAVKSQEAYAMARKEECLALNSQYLYLLNIQENKHKNAQNKKLRDLRKRAKILALNRAE